MFPHTESVLLYRYGLVNRDNTFRVDKLELALDKRYIPLQSLHKFDFEKIRDPFQSCRQVNDKLPHTTRGNVYFMYPLTKKSVSLHTIYKTTDRKRSKKKINVQIFNPYRYLLKFLFILLCETC